MSIEELYQLYLQHPVISTDTRKITPGSIFFALKGDKFDANTFAAQALEAGAAYAVIDNAQYRADERCLLVDDVLESLQNLARLHRKHLQIPVVGLTGSNGKTTTKELINAVLSQQFKTFATQGNLNNHIGVPLSILSITTEHEMAVIEMGANHQKEIEFLCTISQPSCGLITNVGRAHLEGFGGVEGVKKGKGELYDYLKAAGGVVFLNTDSTALREMQQARHLTNVFGYGTNPANNNLVTGRLISNSPFVKFAWHSKDGISHEVQTNLTGSYNLDNMLAAVCTGLFFNLTADQINQGISSYQPTNNRSQIEHTATNTIICDYYNANPSSMAVAIENVSLMQADYKVMILGDMFELGDESAAEHEQVIVKAMAAHANRRIFVGKEFYKHQVAGADFYETTKDAFDALKVSPIKNATVLIKGSRGMALEQLKELF
ncbi:UDP-N-acetylmuramoyl-tripeptide--D-alanyl-D-alanine ligase [Mucilaginibacter sp. RS28]|uniref:UDP-N-acetylmuramoyl-tripeptide--D-alanyl-D-alanine ligase n=1 Tax=Mucilaginibacter straminoryzae TaxID=2932774 RepID=A0A9X1WZZ1_9SPHI|nr:UDP-N-acetylmuramoyl-tripeptide--D-alanyl-D-alanine ligase [Mucilaginibacter straminoryzae]MCJ8208256.1 UDP-N-acetylmuramoyl-tripeptide--D-alanyl-D-alanine ligase [Mucilaginibacter straminoryzae]